MPAPSPTVADAVAVIIHGEPAARTALEASLRTLGCTVHGAGTAASGLQLAGAVEPDVIVVDLGLRDMDGVEVCRQLRRWTPVPILVLAIDGTPDREIEALDAGADDFVAEPFSMARFLARVRVAIRHGRALAHATEPGLIIVGPLHIDVSAHEATLDGAPMSLTRKEFALLTMLARNVGRVILHRVLIAAVWDSDVGRVELLRTHVNQLRRKLGEAPTSVVQIVNEPGVGYRLVLRDDT